MLRLGTGEVVPPIEAEQCCGECVRRRREHPQPPAEQPRGQAQAGNGVARVVLAVAECAFAILPGFPPVHRRKPDERAAGRNGGDYRRQHFAGEPAAALECMFVRQIMVDPGNEFGVDVRRQHQITLGRMQVAARWIIAQRPTARSGLLPGAEPQAQFEEQAQRRPVERRTRPLGRPEKVVVGEHPLARDQRQWHDG